MSRPATEINALRRTRDAPGAGRPYPKRLCPAVRRLLSEGLLRQDGRLVSLTEEGRDQLAQEDS